MIHIKWKLIFIILLTGSIARSYLISSNECPDSCTYDLRPNLNSLRILCKIQASTCKLPLNFTLYPDLGNKLFL